jgi:DNA-binding response OmpR family regulator
LKAPAGAADDVFMTAQQLLASSDEDGTRNASASHGNAAGTPVYLVLMVGHAMRPDAALQDDLARGGIRCLWFQSIAQALGAAAHAQFDAAVLHVGGALAAVAARFGEWHQSLRCPIVVVTDQRDDVDEIIALELGADAYLPLPLPARRLSAHLHALVRRRVQAAAVPLPSPAAAPLQAGGWSLDRVRNRLTRGEQQVDLPDALATLMQLLMQEQGRVVPRSRLIAGLGKGRELNARSVDRYVARLRQRLHDERVEGLRIDGVRGRGYSLHTGPASPVPSHLLRWLAPAEPANERGLRVPGGVPVPT